MSALDKVSFRITPNDTAMSRVIVARLTTLLMNRRSVVCHRRGHVLQAFSESHPFPGALRGAIGREDRTTIHSFVGSYLNSNAQAVFVKVKVGHSIR